MIYFKKLAYVIMGAGKFEICKAGCKLKRKCFYVAVLRQNYFFLRKLQLLLLRPSNDWMRPAHIMEGDHLYLRSTD